MGYSEVVKRIKEADTIAAEHIQQLLSLEFPFTIEKVYPHVRGYILSRFLLEENDEDDLKKLVSSSISKSLEISENDLDVTDLSERCISAPSVETKLVILMFRMEEALGIKLEVMERVNADTVRDLAEAVTRHLNEKSQS